MATYAYDDFRVEFVPRSDGAYDLLALSPDGSAFRSKFEIPLSMAELRQTIVNMALERSRAVDVLDQAPTMAMDVVASREVAPQVANEDDDVASVCAEELGALLADALFDDGLGAVYDAVRHESSTNQRGLRLTLSLEQAPALLSLPWEFLYRRPRFIASQRHTPLVRCLSAGELPAPPTITDKVKILGVVSSPRDLTPLDVDAEREHIRLAVADMVEAGRVELDWLDPATPATLRHALRDENYHVIHYVGHSSFTSDDEGAIYLEDDTGAAVAVDSTVLANLVSDQSSLRLVVLNSCEGARTTLSDPYAGVATTLIHLGVPAVVAMQFEISDKAAILFANELYTNLIGRQDPIDASVGEARKAIYVEVDRIEWATPVLFVRDPNVRLFDFRVPQAPLPPTSAPEMKPALSLAEIDELESDAAEPHAPLRHSGPTPLIDVEDAIAGPTDAFEMPEIIVSEPSPARARTRTRPPTQPPPPDPGSRVDVPTRPAASPAAVAPRRRRRWILTAAVAFGVLAAVAGSIVVAGRLSSRLGEPQETVVSTSDGSTAEDTEIGDAVPRPNMGYLSVQVRENSSNTHLYALDPQTLDVVGNLTDKSNVVDMHADWDPNTNRVAFARSSGDATGTGIFYVVPGDFGDDAGKQVAPLIPSQSGEHHRHPVWSVNGDLYSLRTDGCQPGRNCVERLHHSTFDAATDASGALDDLSVDTDRDTTARFRGVTAAAADTRDASRLALVDSEGLWLADPFGVTFLLSPGLVSDSIAFTADGRFVVAIEELGGAQGWAVYRLSDNAEVVRQRIVLDDPRSVVSSVTAASSGSDVVALSMIDGDASSARLTRVSFDVGSVTRTGDSGLDVGRLGTPQAVAL